MGHGETHVEHLLLGLLSPATGLDQLWAQFDLTIAPVRDQVRERLPENARAAPPGLPPFAPDAQTITGAGGQLHGTTTGVFPDLDFGT